MSGDVKLEKIVAKERELTEITNFWVGLMRDLGVLSTAKTTCGSCEYEFDVYGGEIPYLSGSKFSVIYRDCEHGPNAGYTAKHLWISYDGKEVMNFSRDGHPFKVWTYEDGPWEKEMKKMMTRRPKIAADTLALWARNRSHASERMRAQERKEAQESRISDLGPYLDPQRPA